jgi:HPt (histidine-containing phosphotransfer) domain-containing protein
MRLRDLAAAVERCLALQRNEPSARSASARRSRGASGSTTSGCGLDLDAALAELDGDMDLLRDLAQLFLDDSPRLLAAIRDAAEAQDAGAIGAAAHALKGSIASFGVSRALQTALRLESMGREGRISDVNPHIDEVETEIGELRAQLSALLANSEVRA